MSRRGVEVAYRHIHFKTYGKQQDIRNVCVYLTSLGRRSEPKGNADALQIFDTMSNKTSPNHSGESMKEYGMGLLFK